MAVRLLITAWLVVVLLITVAMLSGCTAKLTNAYESNARDYAARAGLQVVGVSCSKFTETIDCIVSYRDGPGVGVLKLTCGLMKGTCHPINDRRQG